MNWKIKKPKVLPIGGGYESHYLNEILPYLPKEDCFFDTRHWVCSTTEDVLPFALTTKISSNSQQYLRLYLNNKSNIKLMNTEKTPKPEGKGWVWDSDKGKWFRIRKLTPRECFRLMGVQENNIDILMNSGISNSQLYKMAGNSIVVDPMYYMFKNLFYPEEVEVAEPTLF